MARGSVEICALSNARITASNSGKSPNIEQAYAFTAGD
jgi:hypothetical protein